MLPIPKVPLPDGVYTMGCLPIFHTLATEGSSRTPPLMATAFHVGVPQALLEEHVLRDVLLERHPSGRLWSEGSLVVLLTSSAIAEAHLLAPNQSWATPKGWLRQEHHGFFALHCCFRFLLGLEYVTLWHELRQTPAIVTLEDFLPFLKDINSGIRMLSVRLDMTSEHGAMPVLTAPRVQSSVKGTQNFAQSTVGWGRPAQLGSEPTTLKEFAKWVGHLAPGRVIYSSHKSRTADLYLKLHVPHVDIRRAEDVVVAIAFVNDDVGLTGDKLYQVFADAVGEPSWWGVKLVSLIVLTSKLSHPLEVSVSPAGASCATFRAGQALPDGGGDLPNGCEIILCLPQCLNSFLGTLRTPVFTHEKIFERDIAEEANGELIGSKQKPDIRSWQNRAVGTGRNAVQDWRAKRPTAPKGEQLNTNLEALRGLLAHVHTHGKSLAEAVAVLNSGDEDSGLESQASSRAGTPDQLLPKPSNASSGAAKFLSNTSSGSQKKGLAAMDQETVPWTATSAAAGERIAAMDLFDAGDADDEEENSNIARIDKRCPSPERTIKSQNWRPPTPHPCQGADLARRQQEARQKEETRLEDCEHPAFDFIGFGDWRATLPDANRRPSRQGKPMQGQIRASQMES